MRTTTPGVSLRAGAWRREADGHFALPSPAHNPESFSQTSASWCTSLFTCLACAVTSAAGCSDIRQRRPTWPCFCLTFARGVLPVQEAGTPARPTRHHREIKGLQGAYISHTSPMSSSCDHSPISDEAGECNAAAGVVQCTEAGARVASAHGVLRRRHLPWHVLVGQCLTCLTPRSVRLLAHLRPLCADDDLELRAGGQGSIRLIDWQGKGAAEKTYPKSHRRPFLRENRAVSARCVCAVLG